jgi:hypothetical protein
MDSKMTIAATLMRLPVQYVPPFSAAFNTPRPPGILTNSVREVPFSVSGYPEDLYDALEIEFQQAMLQNSERKHKTRVT